MYRSFHTSIKKTLLSAVAVFTALSLTVTAYADSFPYNAGEQTVEAAEDGSIIGGTMGQPYILSQGFIPDSEAQTYDEAEAIAAQRAMAANASGSGDTAEVTVPADTGRNYADNDLSRQQKSKAYTDGFNDGKAGKALNEKYSQDAGQMKAYREGFAQGENQARHDDSLKLKSATYKFSATQTFDFVKEQRVLQVPDKGMDISISCAVSGDSSRVSEYVLYAQMPGKKEYQEIKRSSNGVLEFKLTKDYWPDGSGNTAKFKVTVTDKNKKWCDTDLNITVKKGTVGTDLDFNAGGIKPISIKIPKDVPYLGGSDLSLNNIPLPIFATMTTDGTIRVGVNLKKDMLKNGGSLLDSFKKSFDQMMSKPVNDAQKSFDTFKDYLDSPKKKIGAIGNNKPGFGFDLNVVGYGESKMGDSGAGNVSLNVLIGLNVKAEFGWQFVVWVIPVVVEVTITGNVTARFMVQLDMSKKDITGNVDIQATIKLEGFAGIGLRKIISAGAYGVAKAILNMKILPSDDAGVTKFSISGGFGIKLSLFCLSYEKLFVDKEYVIYQKEGKKEKLMSASGDEDVYADMYDISNYTLINEDYKASLAKTANSDILISDSFPGADPSSVNINGSDKLVTFLSTVPDRNQMNKIAVYYTYYDSSTDTWSKPSIADGNTTLDGIHDLFCIGNDVYLVYTNADEVLPENAEITSFTSHMGLTIKKFDTETKKFTDSSRISETGKYVSDIAMDTVNGVPTLIWVQSSNPEVFGNHSENEIAISRFKNGVWSAPEIIVSNCNCIGDITVGSIGGKEKVLYFYDQDGDLSTYNDYALASADGGIISTGSISYLNFAALPYGRYPIWIENGSIMQLTESGKNAIAENVGNAASLESHGNMIYFVKNSDDGGSYVYGVEYNDGKYSAPFIVVQSDGKIRDLGTSGSSIIYTESTADLDSASDQSGIVESSNIKLTSNEDFYYSVDLESVDVITEELIPGEYADIDLTVFNNSSKPLDGFSVSFTSADGRFIHTEDVECDIDSGETDVIRVKLPVPEKLEDLPVKVKISGIKENTGKLDSNSKYIDMMPSPLELEAANVIVDDKPMFEVDVTNVSRLETGARIEFTDDDGKLLHTEKIDNLSGMEDQSVFVDPALLLPSGESFGMVNVTVYPNNSTIISDSICEYVYLNDTEDMHTVTFYDEDINLLSTQLVEDGDDADIEEFPSGSFFYDLLNKELTSAPSGITEDKYYMLVNDSSLVSVHFDANGGSRAPADQVHLIGDTAELPESDPIRTGYTFKFWSADGTSKYDFASPLTENITLKAIYDVNRYTITFNTNGGTQISPITQDYGTPIKAPANPTRTGYTFAGWDKPIPKTMPAGNMTITAIWKAISPYSDIPVYIPTIKPDVKPTTTDTTGTTTGTAAKTIDISDYNISGVMSEINGSTLKWDKIPGASGYSLYIKADDKYVFVQDLGNTDKADVVLAWNGRYYVSAGKDYTIYKYSAKTGKFVKTGTLKAEKIDSIIKANNVTIDYMVKYTVNGRESAEKDSYKVSVKIYYKPALRLTSDNQDGKSSIAIKWNKVPGSTKYKVYKYVNGKLKFLTETTKRSVLIIGTKPGNEYTYAVKAYVDGKWTDVYESDLASVTAK